MVVFCVSSVRPKTEVAQLVTTVQMLVDLVAVGVVVRRS
jgi:hypothetical protein